MALYFKLPTKQFFLSLSLSTVFSLFTPSTSLFAIDLTVGIVQRFGDNPEDTITLTTVGSQPLLLRFSHKKTKEKIFLYTKKLQLGITKTPLPKKQLQEVVVLGDYGTFETAEDDANHWRRLGIDVEITQPGRWQVWAKRSTYNTPLLRRLLLQQLQQQGYQNVYLESRLVAEKPEVTFTVSGQTYRVDWLEISNPEGVTAVKDGQNGKWTKYAGSFTVQPNSYGDYTLVNRVDLETYLRGVVPHEIGSNAPRAAVEAQTIIARTYALRNTRRFEADNYQLCATTHCQVYYGLSGTSPVADAAITATRGLVLTYNNELVDALYSSTSGGVTSNFSDIWNGENRPYLKPIIDAPYPVWNLAEYSLDNEANFRKFISLEKGFNETGRSLFRWQKQSSLAELTSDLQRYLTRIRHPLADFKTIREMKVVERAPSGRILKLEVVTDLGVVILEKNEVRSAFTPPRSTLFYLEPVYDSQKNLTGYKFIGGGFGHGVGLSQFGSYNLARLGWTAQQILQFYYPGTVVQPLNDSIVFWRPPSVSSHTSKSNDSRYTIKAIY
ncbi:MAG: SpoIID/LytB domain-containing protein [Geminocystis sp.]|nr:SpoIID/LytB domain-containing protein [Geminocystis sp.]MCS7147910.1 SpoIID/LytB domain-containing protein [Geminocystis sp.]MDW8116895.1 SpoIID/LytB domain-containing protein [Geminocystis sp.]MDW8462459.1 SpoIID/LytB domain-containing protein [Geminocystis sp.]HIK36634.1 SpoIID/LytB domain-containing protein [Geminocystis sp. M7585_C2015_104]